ncbi:hypothetical protein ABIB25_001831 [Nakamurella sp. UYEF19]|uniref:hypothetical protein n=1 Tax=Nakamurella sp. UYEF19 TaxID=1756392 RepID=UPI003397A17D
MGRHSAPETDRDDQDRTVPILRMPSVRTRPGPERLMRASPGSEQQVPGVLFPIVDDLSMIAADDQMLDLIASGRSDFGDVFATLPMASGYPRPVHHPTGVLEPLLITWRCELAEAPLPATPCPPVLVRVMRAPADKPSRRAIRPMVAAAAAICALLLGSTAVGARSAEPGDPLWALTQVLYSSHAKSVEAGIKADNSMETARSLLKDGDAPKALVALTSASGDLERVELGADRQRLQTKYDTLWIKAHNETEAATSSTSSSGTPGRGAPAIIAAAGAATGTHTAPRSATSAPATSGSPSAATSLSTTGVSTTPSRPGSSTAPVVIVAPPVKPTTSGAPSAPVKQPTQPVTTPPQQSSAPPAPTTAPVITPPQSAPVTTPTTSASAPPSSDPVMTSPPPPPPSTDPVTSDTVPAATEVSTTSEMPAPTSVDSSSDPLAANGAAPAQVTDASQ